MAPAKSPSQQHFPLAGGATDGWSTETDATATCYCGEVQLAFPTQKPGLITTFVCNCTDCRKITASMFASNFIIHKDYVKHLRGRENLTRFGQSKTIATGNTMINYFCKTCGTLMYRISSGPRSSGDYVMRLGTVDDFNLHETSLRPQFEAFTKDRVSWFPGCETVVQYKTFPTKQPKALAGKL
ncbi:hypothetical protein MBLNU230_g6268t1 [Neophaeotheca triangularis]